MRILVVNPNTTVTMTDAIAATARRYASPGTAIVPLTAAYGAAGIDCAFESYVSAVAVMDAVASYQAEHPGGFDAVVMAGFGEHGREGVQELTRAPVIDMCEASAHVAQLVGRSYAVVTTLARSIAAIEDRLRLAGLDARCASVRATGLATLDVERDPERAVQAVVEQALLAVRQDRAEVICLGCGGMAGLEGAVARATGVPVVDGVGAAVRLAEAVAGLGLSTSPACTYAPADPSTVPGWPFAGRLATAAGER